MTRHRLQDNQPVHALVSPDGGTCAEVAPGLGGIVSSFTVPGPDGQPRECLYRHPWFWEGHPTELRGGIPLLFPVCGRLLQDGTRGLYHVGDRPYVLPIHGFALRLPWKVVQADTPDSIRLRLTDTPATHAMYPFPFELELDYAVSPARLDSRLTVRNTGPEPMPYYAGWHPYFDAPPPGRGKEQTLFDIPARRRRIYNDTLTDIVATGPAPEFPVPITHPGINETLLEVDPGTQSRLLHPDGFAIRQSGDALLPCRQLYTLPDRPFFCDEPWMAPPGSMNRPGAPRLLPPGAEESTALRIEASKVP
jgi:galactose mutarotase-like enzyme